MPNSNPACTPPYSNECKCESGGEDFPVLNTLQLNWDATAGAASSTGSVALVKLPEHCLWRGVHDLICEIDGLIYTHQFVFELQPTAPNGNESCGWALEVSQGTSYTPNATPNSSDCIDVALSALSDYNQANPWQQTTCACDPLDLTFYAAGSEDHIYSIEVSD